MQIKNYRTEIGFRDFRQPLMAGAYHKYFQKRKQICVNFNTYLLILSLTALALQ